jgi:hypothetical protein
VIRRTLPLLLAALVVTACSDDEPEAAPLTSPAPSATAAPPGRACDYLLDSEVSDALGDTVEGVPTGTELCSWGELSLSVLTATPEEFDEERAINVADADVPPPPLGLGDDSYLILGEPGGTGSAGVLVGSRKAVLALPGDVPQDVQRAVLVQFATKVSAQL